MALKLLIPHLHFHVYKTRQAAWCEIGCWLLAGRMSGDAGKMMAVCRVVR
jgi:hypothetical protein